MQATESRPRRILMIAPTPFFADRGCHVRILGEAKALIEMGHELVLCTYFLGRDVEGVPTARTVAVPWYRKLSAGPSWHKVYIDLFLLWTVLSTCRRFGPDILHAHLHEGIVIGKIASLIFRVPLVADLQGSLTDELLAHKFLPNLPSLVRFVAWIESKVNRMPAHLIVSSSHTAKACVGMFGVDNERVSSIMDGVDLHIFQPIERDISLQTSLGIVAMKGENDS